MGFMRTIVVTAVLAAGLLLCGHALATEISMANGSVTFTTPDSWLGILQTDGDPEVRVFQVPDPSPTARNSLARVTVTVKQVSDVNGFHAYMDQATAKAMALPGYKAPATAPAPNSFIYTAREAGVPSSYIEHYWFKNGLAIQLRCVRPAQSQAGKAWVAAFDHGCDAIAAQLK